MAYPYPPKHCRFSACLAAGALLLAACSNDAPADIPAIVQTADTTPATGSSYKRFTGTIGGTPVVVHLTVAGERSAGCYYGGTGVPVTLFAAADTSYPGFVRLDERNIAGSSAADTLQDHWLLRVGKDTAWGTWTSGDGSTRREIRLRESYPAGSYPLELVFESARAAYSETEDTPYAVSTHALLWPAAGGDTRAGGFIARQFLRLMGCGDTTGAPSPDRAALLQCVAERNKAYFSDYRKTIAGAGMRPEALKQAFNNYSRDMYWDVLGNGGGWLIVELISGEYTGGAHGNYNVFYHCIDVSRQQLWTLEDIMTADSSQLKVLLDIAARRYFRIADSGSLQERLLVQEVPVTGNIYLTPAGIVFCYQPYEIASYADGVIPLFIPYKELKYLLTDAFRTRMRLDNLYKAVHT